MSKKTINSNVEKIMGLTPMQNGMLYHKMLNDESTEYVLQHVFSIQGKLYEDLLKQSIELLTYKYEVLRTVFLYRKVAQPKQVILKQRKAMMQIVDLTTLTDEEQQKNIELTKSLDVHKGFDLEKDNLFRVTVIRLSDTKSILLQTVHHIIMDGWCNAILFQDLIKYYEALKSGKSYADMMAIVEGEKRRTAPFSSYVKWVESQDENEGLDYWKNLLEDYSSIAEIKPMVKPRKTSSRVDLVELQLEKESSKRLQEYAVKYNLTLNTVLEAAWGVVLQRYNYTDDVVFGKVVSGRNAAIPGIDHAVGLFINTIPVRVQTSETDKVVDVLKRVQEQAMDSVRYDYCSLAEVQQQSELKQNLIKTLFVYENYYVDESMNQTMSDIDIAMDSQREQTNYGLSVGTFLTDCIHAKFMFDPNEYEKQEVERIAKHYLYVLEEMSQDIELPIKQLSMIDEEETQLVTKAYNSNYQEYDHTKDVISVFEEIVDKYQDHTAVVYQSEHITYQELNRRANRIASWLRSRGIGEGNCVAVMTRRGIAMIEAIYGVIKSGGAYVPIDLSYPKDRIEYILKDCSAKAIITTEDSLEDWDNLSVLCLSDPALKEQSSENPVRITTPDSLLYIIYTSGTTGRPKGVMVGQRGLLNLREYFIHTLYITSKDHILNFANYVFDGSVWEMNMALLTGATLYVTSDEQREDTKLLQEYIKENQITKAALPPMVYQTMDDFPMELLVTAGAAADSDVVKKATTYGMYVNSYGPTECTVAATHWECKKGAEVPTRIPIGKPINNVSVYIMNGDVLCGIGVLGELCIGGEGVAKGYLNLEELTNEKVAPAPVPVTVAPLPPSKFSKKLFFSIIHS